MMLDTPANRVFFERASQVMPFGVNSSHRYWGDNTPMIKRGAGAYLYDFDGRRYIDYRLGFGSVVLGHAHPFVNERVCSAIASGATFSATHAFEVELAERIVRLCSGVEMVRMDGTGSDATRHAIRLARGYTGRDRILKFEGAYHGDFDYMLWTTPDSLLAKVGTRHQPVPHKSSEGVPNLLEALLVTLPWNDQAGIETLLAERGSEFAAVIVEPILANAGGLMPTPGFLAFLRAQCDRHGIVLIFDEVKTGFRIAQGGAAELFGVQPDLACYAKALGNGFPISAVGGRREVMMALAPGRVVHAGTYTGNIPATAAALATLEYMETEAVIARLQQTGSLLMHGLDEILTRHDIPHHLHGVPSLFGLTLSEAAPADWRDVLATDLALAERLLLELVGTGIMTDSDPQQTWYVSASHSAEDIAQTLECFETALTRAKAYVHSHSATQYA
jgi:glutamate-1-semialdehyde 2,1-aminomutase